MRRTTQQTKVPTISQPENSSYTIVPSIVYRLETLKRKNNRITLAVITKYRISMGTLKPDQLEQPSFVWVFINYLIFYNNYRGVRQQKFFPNRNILNWLVHI